MQDDIDSAGFDRDRWWHGNLLGEDVVLKYVTEQNSERTYVSGQQTIDLSVKQLTLFTLLMAEASDVAHVRILPAFGIRPGSQDPHGNLIKSQLRRALRIAEVPMDNFNDVFYYGGASEFRGAMNSVAVVCEKAVKEIRKKSKSQKSMSRILLLEEIAGACRSLSFLTRIANDWLLFEQLCEAVMVALDGPIENCKA